MRGLRDIRLEWRHLALIAFISLGACTAILLGGSGKSDAQLAALAALHHPGTVTVARSPATHPGSSNSNAGTGPSSGSSPGGGSNSVTTPVSNNNGGPTNTNTTTTSTSTTTTTSTTPTKQPNAGLPKVKHVFEIALSTPSYKAAFESKSQAPYLKTLAKRGTVLTHFYSLGSGSELADYLAMVSGQKPNANTSVGCPKMKVFSSHAKIDKAGNVKGDGCLYPQTVSSIASQAEFEAQSWGAYIQDQGVNCAHVNPGSSQAVVIPGTEPGYDSLHNPFTYFDGLLSDGSCSADDQDLKALPKAMKKVSFATPSIFYVAPDACADGNPQLQSTGTTTTTTTTTTPTTTTTTVTTPTTTSTTTTTTTTPTAPQVNNQICPTGEPSGLAAENTFLKTWVPKILASKAYKDHGVLVIAFAGSGAKHSGATVRTGALVISKYTKHGAKVSKPFGPYSLLRSVSDMLNYPSEAQASTAKSFAKLVLR